eukprot:NODE_8504_length_672_cov_29.136612_g7880_i0.p1 GENE.NODE_8504_length_672_cov_29.136612_g7880_i0~~NODE_8504_length_672_cov_29.136612_g7880_i0.p1  ORF type:complete len:181 (-),score=40.92 NODE_8504_length_672_cov_29.136612_g7880_i0:68-610(-)
MRGVLQRVAAASVTLRDTKALVSEIQTGICVLVGIGREDTIEEAKWLSNKILSLRVFSNEEGKGWSKSVVDIQGEVLLVSQFTLLHVLKGNKPDFHNAMGGPMALDLFNEVVRLTRSKYISDKVKVGSFGEHMMLSIVNDGPVTLTLDSPVLKAVNKPKDKKTDETTTTTETRIKDIDDN